MDCAAFQESEIDALYDELDAETSAAMEAHAVGCAACAARLGRLRAMRRAIAPTLLEELPVGLEDRVVAAAVAALPPVTSKAPEKQEKGAKIFAFLARPQLAVAAGFVLVLGAAALYATRGAMMANEAAPTTASKSLAPGEAANDTTTTSPTATAAAVAAGGAPAPAPMASGLAFDPSPIAAPGKMKGAYARGGDPAFISAKALYDDGNCADALPKLEALAKTNGEADLYAARCVEQTRGCKAAAPRFDVAAKRNAGSEIGSRASLESARCYDSSGQPQTARARYKALENDPYVAGEARSALQSPAATATATPPPATHR